MSPRVLFAAALLTASFLAAASACAGEIPPAASPADGVAAFLLREDSGARSFVSDAANNDALAAVARSWAAKAEPRRVANLVAVATPGSSAEGRLVQALSKWTKTGRIAAPREKDGAVAFLEDAAVQAEKLLSDPRVHAAVDEAVAARASNETAIARARKLSAQRMGTGGLEQGRSPGGAVGDSRGVPGSIGAQALGGIVASGGAPVGSNPAGRVAPGTMLTPAGADSRDPAVVAASAAKIPASQRPKSYSTPLAPPPLNVVELNSTDRAINTALSVVNMESYSRGDTINRESTEGTQASICKYLKNAKYDPDEAWGAALAARKAPGADPGDLDLRNAEHYLYAYSTTAKPNGWGDSTPVQLMMAVGWTPFKTVTKHVRPTSKPSIEEAKWGVKGAWHGQHPPDWRATCEGTKS
jgi:hypothetical protein